MDNITKINFGCGANMLEGYLNIDAAKIQPAICMENNYLFKQSMLLNPQEFHNDYFTLIKAQMVFEHIHPDMIPSVIYTMSCLLKMDSKVLVTVPNFDYFAKKYFLDVPNELDSFKLKDLSLMRETMFQLLDPMMQTNDVEYRGHQSFWTPAMAHYWFEGEGFSIEDMEKDSPVLKFTAVKKSQFTVAKDV